LKPLLTGGQIEAMIENHRRYSCTNIIILVSLTMTGLANVVTDDLALGCVISLLFNDVEA
jgi:hypothetical protein